MATASWVACRFCFESEVIIFRNGRIKEKHFQPVVVHVIVVMVINCIGLRLIDICLYKHKAAGQSAPSE